MQRRTECAFASVCHNYYNGIANEQTHHIHIREEALCCRGILLSMVKVPLGGEGVGA